MAVKLGAWKARSAHAEYCDTKAHEAMLQERRVEQPAEEGRRVGQVQEKAGEYREWRYEERPEDHGVLNIKQRPIEQPYTESRIRNHQ